MQKPLPTVGLALVLFTLVSGLLVPCSASAQDRVLFVTISGGYNSDGANAFAMLVAAGADADYVELSSNGQVATAINDADVAGDPYDQIWVYDLSTGSDNYPADYVAISSWFSAQPDPEMICDGRFLSSFWSGRYLGEGAALAENYYVALATRGGGLVLGTDHDSFASLGMNVLGAELGIDPFIGNFGGSFPVDSGNPLMTTPNDLTAGLFNDSSTSQTPFNLQPNGLILHTVGFHSGNTQNPGIASTIDGALNMLVTIDTPVDGFELCDTDVDSVTATSSISGQLDPVTYTWSSSIDGTLGGGDSIVLDTTLLSDGTHTITILAEDAQPLFDDDDITVIVNGPGCPPDTDGDGVLDVNDNCVNTPNLDQADADLDGIGDVCDDCPVDGDPGDVDGDGVCDSSDVCTGDDALGDTDGDGICDDLDVCTGDDALGDTDGDGICNDLDVCTGDDALGDADGDGVCDDLDICEGDDATGDGDLDSWCADLDCDDADSAVFPGAGEVCNGRDDDCDGVLPADESDSDGDGQSECEGDCDDADANNFSANSEICDGQDNDCDGLIPDDELDSDGDGWFDCEGDCDEARADVFPGAVELCDGTDNDCDGEVPADELDSDGDGVLDCAEPPVPELGIQGSGWETGCDARADIATGSNKGTLALLLVGLALLGQRRRRQTMPGVTLLLVAVLGVPAMASAAEPDLGFHPMPQSQSFLIVRDATHSPNMELGLQFGIDYTLRPLEAGRNYGGHEGSVIDHQFGLDLGVALSLTEIVQIGLRLPFLNVQGGTDEGFAHAAAFGHSGDRVGFGDLSLDVAFGVLQQGKRDAPLSLALVPRFVFPTSTPGMWEGGGAMYIGGDLAVGGAWGPLHLMGNVGVSAAVSEVGEAVVSRDSRSPVQIGGVLGWDDFFRWGLGIGLRLHKGQVEPMIEWTGSTVIAPEYHAEAGTKPFEPSVFPMELAVSVLMKPKAAGPVWWRVGASRGLTPGFGAPDLRIFGTVGVDFLLKKRTPVELDESPESTSKAKLTVGVTYLDKHLADTPVLLRGAQGGGQQRLMVENEALSLEVEPNTAWTAAASRDCLIGTGAARVDSEGGELNVVMQAERTIPLDFDLKDEDGNPVTGATIRWNQDPNCIGCVPEEKVIIETGQLRQMVCPGEHELFVEREGYRVVRSVVQAKAGTAHEIAVEMTETKLRVGKEKIVILEKVYFDFDLASLQDRSHDLLDEVADTLIANPQLGRVEVAGHTDSLGDDAYNQELSQSRAQGVVDYLVSRGVDASRLKAMGYGETAPIDSNDTDAGRDTNRRVEFTILGQ